jgi:putative ABC transport system ATP-binding protein
VAIARALFNRVSLLLCDEPTGALDRKSGHQIMRIFDSLNRDEGLTIVVVTHERYISEMSRETIRLVDGRVVLSGARFPADSWEESRRLSDQLKAARKASEAGEDRAES